MVARRRGWSLVEVIVVVAIVSLLISLLLPALSKVSESGRGTACLATVRGTAQGIYAYAEQGDDLAPARAPAERAEGMGEGLHAEYQLPPSMGSGSLFVPYFQQAYTANLELELGGVGRAEQFTCPAHPEGELSLRPGSRGVFGTYTLPEPFLAAPAAFDPAASDPASGDVSERMARPQRLHEVAHPSRKVMLFERRLFHTRGWWTFGEAMERGVPTPTALGDGHAVLASFAWPLGSTVNRIEGRQVSFPLATVRGILGVDDWVAGGSSR